MVLSRDAREDVDNILTKSLVYRRMSNAKKNLAYDTIDRQNYEDITIPVQCTVQSITSDFVVQGQVLAGDLVGLFRHEYTVDKLGQTIVPTLVPKQGDKIFFLGLPFTIVNCTPATSEDDGIIGWDFTGAQSGKDSDGK